MASIAVASAKDQDATEERVLTNIVIADNMKVNESKAQAKVNRMLSELSMSERRQEILRLVNDNGRMAVSELSTLFGVSDVTVRADLQALAGGNLLVRTHGGAVPASSSLLQFLSLSLRRQQQAAEKSLIGAAAAALVADGDAIFLDSSSTALAIAQNLKDRQYLTVITNSVSVAQELMDAPGIAVVVPGGTLRRETTSLVGTEGLGVLRSYNIAKGFFGAHGLTIEEGLTDVSAEEADVKRAVAAICRRRIAVIDATKWGRVGFAPVVGVDEIDVVISDGNAPQAWVLRMRERGIPVTLVGEAGT